MEEYTTNVECSDGSNTHTVAKDDSDSMSEWVCVDCTLKIYQADAV
jgi:hypothetical protein